MCTTQRAQSCECINDIRAFAKYYNYSSTRLNRSDDIDDEDDKHIFQDMEINP